MMCLGSVGPEYGVLWWPAYRGLDWVMWDANQATEAEVAGLVTVLQEALAELL